jgi:hypothetical protein
MEQNAAEIGRKSRSLSRVARGGSAQLLPPES